MKPIEFTESMYVLAAPKNQEKEVDPLPVYSDKQKCISCWELTDEEIEIIKKTKRVYLGVLSGKTQPPVFLTIQPPFNLEFTRYMLLVKKLGKGKAKRALSQEEYKEYLELMKKFQKLS